MPNPYSPQELLEMSNRKTRQVIAAQSVLTPPSQAIFAFFKQEFTNSLLASPAESGGLK